MLKYRKNPVVIEAFRFGYDEPMDWWREAIEKGVIYTKNDDDYIRTLEGYHSVSLGDWIIKGVAGELYPCKHDIFLKTYERAEDDE